MGRDEVTKAFAEERRRGGITVLFPIRLDDAVSRRRRPGRSDYATIATFGDFRRWKEYDAYLKSLDRLLRDLRLEKA